MRKDRKVTLNIKGIDETLRNEFKAVCARKGISIKTAIENFMNGEVKKELEKHRSDKLQ